MKLIIFLVIVVIIYYLATKIKVIHIDKVHPENKKELTDRKKIKDALTYSYIKCIDKQKPNKNIVSIENFENIILRDDDADCINTNAPKKNSKWLPDACSLVDIIREEFVDSQYKFNVPNLPRNTRYCNKYTKQLDNKYLKQIKLNINEWNELFYQNNIIMVKNMKPIFIIETETEFVMKVNVSLLYQEKTMHMELEYYGQIEKCDEFLEGGCDSYILQLVSIRPIRKSEYDAEIGTINDVNINNPFMPMNEQLSYVDKIKQMHFMENND